MARHGPTVIFHDLDGYATEIPLSAAVEMEALAGELARDASIDSLTHTHTETHTHTHADTARTVAGAHAHTARADAEVLHVRLPLTHAHTVALARYCMYGALPSSTGELAKLYAISAHLRLRSLRDRIEEAIVAAVEPVEGYDRAAHEHTRAGPLTHVHTGAETHRGTHAGAQPTELQAEGGMSSVEYLTGSFRDRYQLGGDASLAPATWASVDGPGSLPDPFGFRSRARSATAEFVREPAVPIGTYAVVSTPADETRPEPALRRSLIPPEPEVVDVSLDSLRRIREAAHALLSS